MGRPREQHNGGLHEGRGAVCRPREGVGALRGRLAEREAGRRGRRGGWHRGRGAGAEVRGGGVGPARARDRRSGARALKSATRVAQCN